MKTLLTTLLLLGFWGSLTRIHDRNAAVQRGSEAYANRRYAEAALAYREAALELGGTDDALWLNLAHATLRAGRPAEARRYYGHLLTSSNQPMRSVALQQLATLAADRGEYAPAVALLRQALLADAHNAGARYNYEVLRRLLASGPTPPPPPAPDGSPQKPPTGPREQQPQPRAGTNAPGQRPNPAQPNDPNSTPQLRPAAEGQPDPAQPSANPGGSASGGFRPGAGAERNVARGSQPGTVRGLSDEGNGSAAPSNTSRRGGTEAALSDEANLQTQRARLQQMNLSPGQARQLLEALRTAEQQYLQQVPRKATTPRDKTKPGW